MRLIFPLISAVTIALSTPAYAGPDASHTLEQFKNILSGKVYVMKFPKLEGHENLASSAFLAADGTNFQCVVWDNKKDPKPKYQTFQNDIESDRWKLTKAFFSGGVMFTTNGGKTRSVPVYHEDTNVLERWYNRKGGRKLLITGHLQETWPAWALEKCPDLKLPEGLTINHDQTTPDYNQNYEATMGKPFPELLNKSLSEVAVPVMENGEAFTPKVFLDKLTHKNGQKLVLPNDRFITFNGEWNSVWESNIDDQIIRVGHLKITEQSISVLWVGDLEASRIDLMDAWSFVNAKPQGKLRNRKVIDWLLTNDAGGSNISVKHYADGRVIRKTASDEKIWRWELHGNLYLLHEPNAKTHQFDVNTLLDKHIPNNPWNS